MADPVLSGHVTATVADVAKAAGVSPATVSRALNGHPTVNPDLVERVTAAAAEINYVPNGAGRALRRNRSDLYAAIIPDVHNAFFTRVVESFEAVANADGFSVVLGNSQEDLGRELDYIDTALSLQVSGVLIAVTSATQSTLTKLERAGVPVVTVDRRVNGFNGDTVTVDNLMVGRLAAEHLVEQGCRNAAVLAGPRTVTSTEDRERGFVQTMQRLGHVVPSNQVLRLDLLAESAAEQLTLLLEQRPEIDAVFAANGPLTSGAFLALQNLGRSMPDDVALVGVDDDHWTRMVTPRVTVVGQPVEQIGRWAGQLLSSRARGHALDHARIVLDPVLQVRESSRRLPV